MYGLMRVAKLAHPLLTLAMLSQARNKVLEAETAKADLELAKERADKHALKHQAAAAGKRLDERQAAVMQAVVALRMVQSLQDEERLARGGCAPPGPSAGGG